MRAAPILCVLAILLKRSWCRRVDVSEMQPFHIYRYTRNQRATRFATSIMLVLQMIWSRRKSVMDEKEANEDYQRRQSFENWKKFSVLKTDILVRKRWPCMK